MTTTTADLSEDVPGLDRQPAALVLAAVAHANEIKWSLHPRK